LPLLFFAITLFVSAFLLFLVQPIVGKMILPKLGGTPQVWNTCMVFFQTCLLAGYFYTHASSTFLNARKQVIVHCILLVIPLAFLLPFGPFGYIAEWTPLEGGNPVFWTLWVLTVAVGVPFLVVATSAPLLQRWFGETGHPAARDPYFLYGASNLGSMLALLLYPVLVEPFFGLGTSTSFNLNSQSWLWAASYIVLVFLVLGCGVMVFLAPPKAGLAGAGGKAAEDRPSSITAPTVPEENANPSASVTPPGPAEEPAPSGDGSSTATTAAAPPPPAPPGPKPGPSTAIKKGSKQKHKQKQKHKHPQPQSHAITKEPPPRSVARTATATAPAAAAAPGVAPNQDVMTGGRRLRWILLAAVPSSLMLGVTTFMSEDVASIPLFWVIPLALYLLSFILVFMRWPITWLGQAHNAMLYIQPVLLAALVFAKATASIHAVVMVSIITLLAFFATALVCHGELARDRPTTRHLTEFYLLMSVGGMLGGMFNGLLAPIMFPGLWEFPIALFLAGIVRPNLLPYGWVDMFLANVMGDSRPGNRRTAHPEPSPGLTRGLDIGIPAAILLVAFLTQSIFMSRARLYEGRGEPGLAYGIPLLLTCVLLARRVRYGLALGGVLFVIEVFGTALREDEGNYTILRERSYFGILHVRRGRAGFGTGEDRRVFPYNNLTHGTTDHGQNFLKPSNPKDLDLSRLATTYYHRAGPAGMAMEKFDWFFKQSAAINNEGKAAQENISDNWNKYRSDARMPASLVGLGASQINGISLPMSQLVGAWSEPAYATIGLGTGTMASYCRPFQTLHFYEIDSRVRRYSLPEEQMAEGDRSKSYAISLSKNPPENYFTYLRNARRRGGEVDILMGDARLRMAQPWHPKEEKWKNKKPWEIPWEKRGGPDGFYHLIVVDAFSSDSIPVHLLTREAIEMYMRKLAPGGVLCVHVSNRHLNLVPVVADIAGGPKGAKVPRYDPKHWGQYLRDENGEVVTGPLVAIRGRDNAPGHELGYKEHLGHTTSEWVMVAREKEDLAHLQPGTEPGDYKILREENNARRQREGYGADNTPYWSEPALSGRQPWTDDYSNLLSVFRWPWSRRSEE
jgi:hypothetical protein